MLNWCKKLTENDLRKIEVCNFDGLYVKKTYINLKYCGSIDIIWWIVYRYTNMNNSKIIINVETSSSEAPVILVTF
jgi:hypothetical protein